MPTPFVAIIPLSVAFDATATGSFDNPFLVVRLPPSGVRRVQTVIRIMSPNYFLRISAKGGLPTDLQNALDDGADVNSDDESGHPVLHLGCLGGHVRCIQLVLDAGADIEAENSRGMTALQVSVEEGRNHSAIMLLDNGADGSVLWKDGRNLLHWAVQNGEERLIARAVRQGAAINGCTRSGKTAIALAAEAAHVGCLKALLECGANINHIKGITLSPEISQIVSAWRARSASETA
jgi:ankyrin repeat protein